ncbi:pyridoxal-phosphate dependent enzyme [Jannaschia sp. S6380]|uniref:threonine ammonia-lyase n=1 Tax=Jannaschia sp. S6380 TaxID=2926408 RepID=UPI001FF55E6C|nr:pyridoxal-phosphate dependent enzyme [Jannaschia sp. S6380]MCK0167635.1 pyridoxal-phosphate dependent enzyme [Jannaschia sp. S6380]
MSAKPSRQVLSLAARATAARRRIAGGVRRTPCLPSRAIPDDGGQLWFKAENLQVTGSFKARGAMAKLTTLPTDVPVITASSGNHGMACANAARTTGHRLTVVLPEGAPAEKREGIAAYGVETILHPGDSGLAERHARKLAGEASATYLSPYNDLDVMSGQGTIALELLEQMPRIDNLFVAMGGGGLISGIGAVMKSVSPATRIIGVSTAASAALAASIEAGRIVETTHNDTLADGCAGGVDADALTLPLAQEVIDRVITCDEAQIADALREIAWTDKMLVEGAAALALAGLRADRAAFAGAVNVVVLCGANFDRARIAPVLAGGA